MKLQFKHSDNRKGKKNEGLKHLCTHFRMYKPFSNSTLATE